MKGITSRSAIILLALIVAASGCVDSTQDSEASSSVSVESFEVVPNPVFSTQEVTARMRLKNTGEQTAEDVNVKLFNIPFGSVKKQEWEGTRNIEFGSLRSADPENNIPATPKTQTVQLQPPELERGISIPYDIMARVSYDYSTKGITEIQLMGEERFRSQSPGRSQPTVDNTAGPVQIGIRTRTPIVFYEGGSTSSDLCITVTNNGEGTTYLDNQENTDKVSLTLKSPGSVQFRDTAPNSEKLGNPITSEIDLISNQGLKCYRLEDFNFESTDIQKTLPITITADYGYFKETSQSVEVKGRGTSDSSTSSTSDEEDGSENPSGNDESGFLNPPE